MTELKDIWFRAYLKGNILMPQTYAAGAAFLAQVVLEQDDLDELKAATELSPSQLLRLRRVMQAAHRVRQIPAGNNAFLEQAREHGRYDMSRTIIIDDDRLQYIWNRFREKAIDVAEVLDQQSQGLNVANQLVAGFQTRECRGLLKRFRAEYDRRCDGSDEAALALRNVILAYVDAQVCPPQHTGILQDLFSTS